MILYSFCSQVLLSSYFRRVVKKTSPPLAMAKHPAPKSFDLRRRFCYQNLTTLRESRRIRSSIFNPPWDTRYEAWFWRLAFTSYVVKARRSGEVTWGQDVLNAGQSVCPFAIISRSDRISPQIIGDFAVSPCSSLPRTIVFSVFSGSYCHIFQRLANRQQSNCESIEGSTADFWPCIGQLPKPWSVIWWGCVATSFLFLKWFVERRYVGFQNLWDKERSTKNNLHHLQSTPWEKLAANRLIDSICE